MTVWPIHGRRLILSSNKKTFRQLDIVCDGGIIGRDNDRVGLTLVSRNINPLLLERVRFHINDSLFTEQLSKI